MIGDVEGYCFLVDPADPFDTVAADELVRLDSLRPGDVFGFIEEADPRYPVLMDEGAPMPLRQSALAGLFRDARRFRFVQDNEASPDGRSRARAEPVEDWRASLAEAR